jgi:hypothetical protein
VDVEWLTRLEIVTNVQVLAAELLDECCFPGTSDSHYGDDNVLWAMKVSFGHPDSRGYVQLTLVLYHLV